MRYSILTPPIPALGSGLPRSGGVHLTQIIWDLGVRLGMVKGADEGSNWDGEGLKELGFIWEDAFELAWKNRMAARPGEVEVDGVSMSADGVGVNDENELRIYDYKCTWKSMGKLEALLPRADSAPEWWYYLAQMKAYCWGWGAEEAVMCFLFVMGDYGKERGPRYREYLFKFEKWELEENWRMVVNHGRAMGLLK
jgi:hypothetical protein